MRGDTEQPEPAALDDYGFVFIGADGDPYWVSAMMEGPRLFYWHAEGHWVTASRQKLWPTEVWLHCRGALSVEQAELYHTKARKWGDPVPSQPLRLCGETE